MAFQMIAGLLVTLAYCLLAHVASTTAQPGSWTVAVAMFWVLLLSFGMAWKARWRWLACAAWCGLLVAIVWRREWLAQHVAWLFFLEHASMQSLLFVAFSRTLRAGQEPMITHFARFIRHEISAPVARYTRALTWVWSGYFGISAVLSVVLFTWAPVGWWSAFANLLGVPLMALIFVGDYVGRRMYLPHEPHGGVMQAIQAYQQVGTGVRPLR